MIADEQMIAALKTARQYCKEHRDCNKCARRKECDRYLSFNYMPEDWKLPGDDEHETIS